MYILSMSASSQKNYFWGFRLDDTNPAVQPQKMTRGLKFWICEVEGSYVTVQLICGFFMAYAKNRFSHDAVHIETYLHVCILSMT